MVHAVRFAMCELIVPAIVSAVSLSESMFVARPEKRLLWAYLPCVEVIVPDVRHPWYASWVGAEIDPHLVAKWLLFPILNVTLVQAASCDEVQGFLEELLGCVWILC